ncbi:copia protein [Tanacetum coccineum]
MFDDYLETSLIVERLVSPALAVPIPVNSAGTPSSTTIDQDAPSPNEIHEFDQLQVWELVPRPDCVMIIALKWIYKVKLDEYGDVLKNKARYQTSHTKKHLEALKRVFWYLRGTINWRLWYPKDTAIALTAYADADHAGCQDTRRSTSGSDLFLRDKLVS